MRYVLSSPANERPFHCGLLLSLRPCVPVFASRSRRGRLWTTRYVQHGAAWRITVTTIITTAMTTTTTATKRSWQSGHGARSDESHTEDSR